MKPVMSLKKIICNYATGGMVTDVLSTVTGFFVISHSLALYWCKILRFNKIRIVIGSVSVGIRYMLDKCLDAKRTENIGYILDLLIIMFLSIHILGCAWIYIGKIVECSWLNQGDTDPSTPGSETSGCMTGIIVEKENDYAVYVCAVYWVITSLTTVGYGDFKGYQGEEYCFQMIVEFLGIVVFSFLMGSINGLMEKEVILQDIIDARIEDVELWLRKLEKTRSKNFSKQLYDCIKLYT